MKPFSQTYALVHLSDSAVDNALASSVTDDWTTTARLLCCIGESDDRKRYLAKGYADEHVKIFQPKDFAYHKVGVVFWQTDEHDQPAIVTEPYEKTFTAANVAKELEFHASELTFLVHVKEDGKQKIIELALKPADALVGCGAFLAIGVEGQFRPGLGGGFAEAVPELAEGCEGGGAFLAGVELGERVAEANMPVRLDQRQQLGDAVLVGLTEQGIELGEGTFDGGFGEGHRGGSPNYTYSIRLIQAPRKNEFYVVHTISQPPDETSLGKPSRTGYPAGMIGTTVIDPAAATGTYEWLRARRRARKTIPITTEELLRQLDEPDPASRKTATPAEACG